MPHILAGVRFQVLQDLFVLLIPVFSVMSYQHLPMVNCVHILLFARLNTTFSSLFLWTKVLRQQEASVSTRIQTTFSDDYVSYLIGRLLAIISIQHLYRFLNLINSYRSLLIPLALEMVLVFVFEKIKF